MNATQSRVIEVRAANIHSYEAPNAPSTSFDTIYIDFRVQQLKKTF